ncbi:transposase [Thiobacillus denitrificans]|uniref:transposase n=1 Tax=Thiobacillus denitrificans TaxID=36861 RepID=UPI00138EE731|nr:transposase [Thiobacillus denitrificans]
MNIVSDPILTIPYFDYFDERWSIETAFAEIKTTLKGADIVLRSKTPELVRQEFWGLLLAHHVVRKLMLEAALSRQRTPDTLSFKHSLSLIRRKLPDSGAVPPRGLPEVVVGVD